MPFLTASNRQKNLELTSISLEPRVAFTKNRLLVSKVEIFIEKLALEQHYPLNIVFYGHTTKSLSDTQSIELEPVAAT